MTDQNQIKCREDGSIDIEHYTRIGRRLRSEHAVGMLVGGTPASLKPRRKWFRFFGAV